MPTPPQDKRDPQRAETPSGNSQDAATGGGDVHYQPWLRNQPASAQPGTAAALGVTRPAPLPVKKAVAQDAVSDSAEPARPAQNLSADELLARPIPMPPTAPEPGPGISSGVSALSGKVGAWTQAKLEQADLASRVEKMEQGARKATAIGKRAVKRTAQSSGTAMQRAATEAAQAAGRAKAAASPRVKAAAQQVKQGLKTGQQAASSAIGQAGRKAAATARKLVDKTPAAALLPLRHDPPPSQLEHLLAQEQPATGQPTARDRADALPLFSAREAAQEDARESATPPAAPAPTMMAASVAMTPDAPEPSGATSAATPARVQATTSEQTASHSSDAPPRGNAAGGSGGGGASSGGGASGGGMSPPLGTRGWLRHPASWVAGGMALMLSGFVGGMMWDGGSNRAVTERIVHDYLLNHPEIIPQAMERLQANRVAAAISTNRTAIETPFSGAWAGAPDGDVTMVVFTDYACTFCRASVADIDRLLREDRRLKVVFRELPILSADSEAAARVALSAAQAGRYMAVHRALFASGRPDAAARTAAAEQFSVDAAPARLSSTAITGELRNNIQIARELGFDGTPSWVIGDRAMTGAVGYAALKSAIAAARAAQ